MRGDKTSVALSEVDMHRLWSCRVEYRYIGYNIVCVAETMGLLLEAGFGGTGRIDTGS